MSQVIRSTALFVILIVLNGYCSQACPFSREQATVLLAKIRMYYPDLIQQQLNNPYNQNQGGLNQGYGQGQGYNNQGYNQGNLPINQGNLPLNQGNLPNTG